MASPIQTWDVGTSATITTGSSRTGPATTAGSLLLVAIGARDEAVDNITLADDGDNTWTLVKKEPYAWLFACSNAAAVTSVTPFLVDDAEEPYSAAHMLFLSEWPAGDVEGAANSSTGVPPVGAEVTPGDEGGTVVTMMTAAVTNRTFSVDGATIIQDLKSSQLQTTVAYETVEDDTPVAPAWNLDSGSSTAISVISAALTHTGGSGPSPLSVDVGSDQSAYVGQTASVSATPTGGTPGYTYAWTKVSGPAGTFLNSNQASTTFNPSGGAGTYVLRCIVTDSAAVIAQDDLALTVTAAPAFVTISTVNSATGWTPTGGTVQQVLSDTSDSTLITSQETPSAQALDVTFNEINLADGQPLVLRTRARRIDSGTASFVAKLYDGSTLLSTSSAVTVSGTYADLNVTFPTDDFDAVSLPATFRVVTEWTAA